MKPVELVLRAPHEFIKVGALVFEPFSGSGTATIIASEQAGRRCRAIELDPQYVQVAVDRWEKDDRQRKRRCSNEKEEEEEAPIGRPTKLSPEIQEAFLLSWLRAPTSKTAAAGSRSDTDVCVWLSFEAEAEKKVPAFL